MPGGCLAFCYYENGSLVDEIDVPPAEAPPRPTTVPLALQKHMPLAQVQDSPLLNAIQLI
jgi:hypothetical protein